MGQISVKTYVTPGSLLSGNLQTDPSWLVRIAVGMNDANLRIIFPLVRVAICGELSAARRRASRSPRSWSCFAFQSEAIGFGTDSFIAGLADILFAQLPAPKSACNRPVICSDRTMTKWQR